MGVPAFTRWLIEKYPRVRATVKEDEGSFPSSIHPNPNGFEFHHLYLDMNSIIHSSFHPDSLIFQPTTYEEVFENVCVYIDRIFSIVRPRKLLYLAIDGVAPRAKMNQQRTRRFRNARDDEFAEKEEKKLREKYERMGKTVLPILESQVLDSNVITPGTEFMFELSNALKFYVVKRLESDPVWKNIKVILSDATVPGEGEHKIMSFIRTLRSIPGYDPNTTHCLYGQDSDLIMLALATHEIHFSILREDVINMQFEKPVSESTIQTTIQRALAEVPAQDKSIEQDKKPFNIQDKCRSVLILPQQYEFLHVWILREYLELDMQIIDPPDKFAYDIERIIDDFIFMCLFMGNDFLPRLPTLDIRERGLDLLMHVYKNEFKRLGGFMVDMQRVNESHASFIKLKRVEKFILSVGNYEEKVFKKRTELTKIFMSRFENSRRNEVSEEDSNVCITDDNCPKVSSSCFEQHKAIDSHTNSDSDIKEMVENTMNLKDELKKCLKMNSDTFEDGFISSDKVKLSCPGWKQRYYKEKFSIEDPKETEILRKEILQKYTEGLCWVLMYYFSGTPSWDWYYPYYYSLFASELKGLAQVKVQFHKGSPIKPFDQLMAVLPPKSAHALPEAYRDLMTSSESKIVEYFPRDFEIDMDGKRYVWQGICKLPFIDQEKLLSVTCQIAGKIDTVEAKRNVESSDHLFWSGSNSCAEGVWDYIVQHTEKREEYGGAIHGEKPIICCNFKLLVPSFRAPRLQEGVQLPEKTVFENDISETQLWHECTGPPSSFRTYSSRCRGQPQRSYRKVGADEPIHKHAGGGWSGVSRGNGNFFKFPESHINISQNQQSPIKSAQTPGANTSRGCFKQLPTSASGPATTVNRRMDGLRISPPSQENISYGGTRNYNQDGNFWTSRNAAPEPQQNATWRPVSYATAATSNAGSGLFRVEGRGRGRGRWYHRQSADTETSFQDPNRW